MKIKDKQELFVVGIGASAGGLEAIETFFKNVPEKPGIAFVVIQHLSPDYKSLMGELLGRHTKLEIVVVKEGIKVEQNIIYLLPPRKNMTIKDGVLNLTDQKKTFQPNLPIDIFFRSLASDKGKYAIGIVLSGTGSDGTMGIKAIKEHEGMIMAQEEESAKFDGMPRSAIASGMVDYVLSPQEMPETLLKFIKHPYIKKPKKSIHDLSSDQVLLRILRNVRDKVGVDFTFYKPNTILRRLEKRLGINQIDSFSDYLEFLEHSPKEAQILYKDLLIGVTQFFRDTEAFDILKNDVLPKLLENRHEDLMVRIWSVGCSTGEEAYSLAILLAEYMEQYNVRLDVKLFATDLDKQYIEHASSGVYPESIATDVSPERLEKFFVKNENGYQVSERIRRMVIYAQQNIIKDPPFSKIDMITCRNMLIYLNSEMQQKIINMFYYSLVPRGILFLGSSETIGDMSDGFDIINHKWKIFQQKIGHKPSFISNYLMPLSRQNKQRNISDKQDFSYLVNEHSLTSDNVFTDLLETLLPPSVIVNENFIVVHLIKDVNDFIKLPAGKANLEILNMVRKELTVVLSSMLNKVLKDGKEVVFKEVRLKEQNHFVNITAKPIKDKFSQKLFIVISFEKIEVQKQSKHKQVSFNYEQEVSVRYSELEKELQFTKENLQATIEELETSNEELQSTNEELIASNEELQSTNEELQSVNEELYTVNSEYQNKIEELTQLNNDMNNLLKNTNIGILYLDRELRIRKFTKLIPNIINILDMDIGRPIEHISLNIDYPDFVKDIEEVKNTLKPSEFEVKDRNGNWNLLRILPYRTSENAIDGITITIIDITNLKQSEQEVVKITERLQSSLDLGNIAWWEWNYETGKVIASDKKSTMLGLSPEETKNYTVDDWTSLVHPEDYELTMQAMRDHFAGKKDLYEVTYRIQHKNGSWRRFYDKGGIIESNYGKPGKLSGVVMDVTEKLNAEQKFVYLFNYMAQGVVYQNQKGEIISANPAAERILGLSIDQMKGRKSIDKRWKAIHEDGTDFPGEEHPAMRALKTGKEIRNVVMGVYHPKSDSQKWILVNAKPIFNFGKDKPSEVFATFEDITEIKESQNSLEQNFDLIRRIMDNSPIGKLVLNKEGEITYANKRAIQIMNTPKNIIEKRKYNDSEWSILSPKGEKIPDEKLPFQIVINNKTELTNYAIKIQGENKKEICLKLNGSPMFDSDNNVDGVVFSLEAVEENCENLKTWKDF